MRTFGLELEISDINKRDIVFPRDGYGFDLEEKDVINSNRTRVSKTNDLGCEVTTRPYSFIRSDLRELRNFLIYLKSLGGSLNWSSGFDMHILVDDFDYKDLVNFFLCGNHITRYILDVFNAPKWFEENGIVPLPTDSVVEKVSAANSIGDILEALSNSSNKGFFRYPFNVATYFKHKTVEFRFFNGSWDFRKVLELIRFGYKFIEVVKSNPNSIYEIRSKEDLISFFGLKVSEIPKNPSPLIFAGSSKSTITYIDKGFNIGNSRVIKCVYDLCSGSEVIHSVNPLFFQIEVFLLRNNGLKKIYFYTVSEDIKLLYNLIKGAISLDYSGEAEFLTVYRDGTLLRDVSLFWFYKNIVNLLNNNNKDKDLYIKKNLDAIKSRVSDTIKLYEPFVSELIDGIKSGRLEIVEDFSKWNKEDDLVVYQQHYNSSSVGVSLSKNSSYNREYFTKDSNYKVNYKVLPNRLIVISRNKYLDMNKNLEIINSDYVCVYSSFGSKYSLNRKINLPMSVSYVVPPDNLVIDDVSKIGLHVINANYLNELRKVYVNKVDTSKDLGKLDLCMAVSYGEYLLGAFTFSAMSVKNGDSEDRPYTTMLACDFSTNNKVILLSKFILLVIKSEEVYRIVSRYYKQKVYNCVTKAYTTKPVSMKYRGVFKKVKRDKGVLFYSFNFREAGVLSNVLREYKNMIDRKGK